MLHIVLDDDGLITETAIESSTKGSSNVTLTGFTMVALFDEETYDFSDYYRLDTFVANIEEEEKQISVAVDDDSDEDSSSNEIIYSSIPSDVLEKDEYYSGMIKKVWSSGSDKQEFWEISIGGTKRTL